MRPLSFSALLLWTALLGAVACGPTVATPEGPPPREPGVRAPLSAACDPTDATRCALPWPSNTFTVADASRATGLRVAVGAGTLPRRDDPSFLNLADGFSRVTPVMAGFPVQVDPGTVEGAMRLLVAQPGAADEAQEVPLHVELVPSISPRTGAPETLLVGLPRRPLAAASDHVVVVLDSLRAMDGSALRPEETTRVDLGLRAAETDEERARFAYHAPTRALLARAGIAPERVLRVWDFTTRSADDPRVRLQAMRARLLEAIDSGEVGLAWDRVEPRVSGPVALVAVGRLTGLPAFRDAEGMLALDERGMPRVEGLHDAPFRVMVPRGEGDWRVVMYGHGTGGNVDDAAFDASIAGLGLGKVGGLFYGWDEEGVIETFLSFERVQSGVARSTAGLMQALADLSAVEHALNGMLGEALAAPVIGGVDNPEAGRRPAAAEPIWTGGSLGGTMGLVYSGLSPRIRFAVLNVAGAGWTHFVPGSDLFALIGPSHAAGYGSALDFRLSLMASQLAWDDVDGANWTDGLAEEGGAYLVQQSMGDPILPNIGTELCAASVGAAAVGEVLSAVPGAERSDRVEGRSALTQYRVPETVSGLGRHGFADRSGPAGDAAREQITRFLQSALSGQPVIELPQLCAQNVPAGSCDFSASP